MITQQQQATPFTETKAEPTPIAKTTDYPKKTITLFRDEPLLLDSGHLLNNVRVMYHAYGQPSTHVTLILHALTGDSAAHNWWPQMVGEGKALDPSREYLICSNVLGGCSGSSSSKELNLPTGSLTLRDMVRVQYELLRVLGVKRVTLIGGSMGGMQAYAWLTTFPDVIDRAVIIAAPARHSPWAIGLNTAARNAISLSPGGEGLKVARQIAMLSYRSPQSLEQTQRGASPRTPHRPAVSTYLEHQGQKLADRFCEESYVTLTAAMDNFQLSDADLHAVKVPVLVVGIDSDQLYPAWEIRQHAEQLGNAAYWELQSPHGHDAFLMDGEALSQQVKAWLAR